MNRRDFVVLSAATLAYPFAARAQRKTPVIGLLWNDSVKPSPHVATLLGALREKGYVDGRDIRIEDQVALEGYGPMAENAAALVRAKVDLIVASGTTATITAAKATKEIPIVMIMGADPVARGLAVSLSRPDGNVTGIATLTVGLIGKRIELLKELLPGLSRVGILLTPNVGNPIEAREAEASARALNLQPHFSEAHSSGDIERAIASLANSRVGAVYMSGSSMLASRANGITAIMAKNRIPAIYASERFVDAGGLMVYAASVKKAFVRVADYVDRILKGARPGELPIEQTSNVELAINLKAAKALGIRIPQSILQRADRAIGL